MLALVDGAVWLNQICSAQASTKMTAPTATAGAMDICHSRRGDHAQDGDDHALTKAMVAGVVTSAWLHADPVPWEP